MTTIYHETMSNFKIQDSWIKDEAFNPCTLNEHNRPWREGIDRGIQYRCLASYQEHYEVWNRVGRIALGILLSIAFLPLCFKKGRAFIQDLLFRSLKNIHVIKEPFNACLPRKAAIYALITGNPAHLGHMQMIALAVKRLVEAGYQIDNVKIELSDEDYLKNKVYEKNLYIEHRNQNLASGERPEMFKVFIPRKQRKVFLREVIQQAKDEGLFDKSLDISIGTRQSRAVESRKVFQVCGIDFVEPDNLLTEPHAVIITRDGIRALNTTECDTERCSRFIVPNTDKTSTYSSTKIQNGAYQLLPASIREEFAKLHEAAQPKQIAS